MKILQCVTALSGVNYRIVGTFAGENLCKLAENAFFVENFCGLLTGTSKGHLPPNFAEKTFTISYKTSKFVKVLLLKSLLLYRVVFYLVAIVFHYSH